MTEGARAAAARPDPYADVRLRLGPEHPDVVLARCVAAEVAAREGAVPGRVEEVRAAVDCMVATLAPLAAPATPLSCLLRVLAGELRVNVSVDAAPEPVGGWAAAGALRRLAGWASAVAVPSGTGECRICADVVIALRD